MPDEDQLSSNREKTRLCPTCRCAISVLATKCRFCGESVGRPKDEARSLSIQDLGGETIVHYAPSSNVMEALESFRMDEVTSSAPPEPKKKTLFGRKATSTESSAGMKSDPGLPELDERGKALASLMVPTRSAAPARPSEPSWMKKVAFLGGFVAVVVILYFGSLQVSAVIRGWSADDTVKSAYKNPVPGMIESGAPVLDIHREALLAVQKDDTPQNREILSGARSRIRDQVEALLSAPTVRLQDLREASNLATQAWQGDRSGEMQDLKSKTDAENVAFAMTLVSVDTSSSPRTATLQLHDRSTVKVKPNDMVQNRFQVQAITDKYVRLIDTMRKTQSGLGRSVQVDSQGIPK